MLSGEKPIIETNNILSMLEDMDEDELDEMLDDCHSDVVQLYHLHQVLRMLDQKERCALLKIAELFHENFGIDYLAGGMQGDVLTSLSSITIKPLNNKNLKGVTCVG